MKAAYILEQGPPANIHYDDVPTPEPTGSQVLVMAKALRGKVITTGGTAQKAAACKADLAINYNTEDVDAAIRKFAPGGVNVWWESLREPNFERTIGLLAPRGRMIVMAGREARPV